MKHRMDQFMKKNRLKPATAGEMLYVSANIKEYQKELGWLLSWWNLLPRHKA